MRINNYYIIIFCIVFNTYTFSKGNDIRISFDYYNSEEKVCFIGSDIQEELLICAVKDYYYNHNNLLNNYEIAITLNNKELIEYIINNQNEWDKKKNNLCNDYLNTEGREGSIEYINCLSNFTKDRSDILRLLFVCGNKVKYACHIEDMDINRIKMILNSI